MLEILQCTFLNSDVIVENMYKIVPEDIIRSF